MQTSIYEGPLFAYFYAVLASIFIVIWMALYFLIPRARLAMFWTSLLCAPAGPISEYWHIVDYWHPTYLVDIAIGRWRFGLEDFLSAFAVAGISTVIFESLALRRGWAELPRISFRTLLRITLRGGVCLSLMALLASGFGMNSIYAIILSMAISSLLMLFGRWEVFLLSIPTAVTLAFLLYLSYIVLFIFIFPRGIETFWNLEVTWGIRLTGIPIEELLWAFVTGLFAGPIFRVCSGKESAGFLTGV